MNENTGSKVSINFDQPASVWPVITKLRQNSSNSGLANILEGGLHAQNLNSSETIQKWKLFLISEEVTADNLRLLFSIVSNLSDLSFISKIFSEIQNLILSKIFDLNLINSIPSLLDAIKFSKASSKEYQRQLAIQLVAPMINLAYDRNFLELALYLENRYYHDFIQRIETDRAFGEGMGLIKDSAESAGKRLSEKLQRQSTKLSHKTKVGFFVHSASMLAHINNIHQFLAACQSTDEVDFEPIIFCLSGRNELFQKSFDEIDVEIIYLDSDSQSREISGVVNRLIQLKSLISEHNVTHIVWVCLAVYMPFAFGLGLSTNQIWWSQKWRLLTLKSIKKYIFSYGIIPEHQFNGVTWKNGYFQQEKWASDNSDEEIARIKNKFLGKVILGTLAREDKLTDARYLAAVSKILRQNPNTVFLWTGRQKLDEITGFFRNRDVLDQTQFIGWVDTNIYSAVFDILLDTFPIGNGLTAIQAMQNGTPVIFHQSNNEFSTLDLIIGAIRSDSGLHVGLNKKLKDIFSPQRSSHKTLYISAEDEIEYVDKANALINDETYRREAGDAYKTFVNELMCSPSQSARIFTNHLLN